MQLDIQNTTSQLHISGIFHCQSENKIQYRNHHRRFGKEIMQITVLIQKYSFHFTKNKIQLISIIKILISNELSYSILLSSVKTKHELNIIRNDGNGIYYR